MNFYQSVFVKNLFQKHSQKGGFWRVITLQYLPFLVLAMSPKIFLKSILNMPQICGMAEKSKTF